MWKKGLLVKRPFNPITDCVPYNIPGVEITDEDGTTKVMYDFVSYEEIQECITPFLIAALNLYTDYALLGVLPHGQGTLGERATVIEILKTLKSEDNKYQNWELEQRMKKDK